MKITELKPEELFVNSINDAVNSAIKSGVSPAYIVSTLEFQKTSIIFEALKTNPEN